MAIGPILGYVSQYRLIKLSKSVGSFSIDICGILLFANILRLNFYMFKQYQTALFFQSILMVSMQVTLPTILCRYCYCTNASSIQIKKKKSPSPRKSNLHCRRVRVGVRRGWSTSGDGQPSKNMVYLSLSIGVTILFFIFCSFTLSLILKATPISLIYG